MIRSFCLVLCLVLAAAPAASPAAGQEPSLHHDVSLRLNPTAGKLQVEDRIVVTGRRDLALYLNPGLTVEALLIDGEEETLEAGQRPIELRLPSNEKHEITLRYSGGLAEGNRRGFIDERGAFLPDTSGWLPEWPERRLSYRLTVTVPAPFRAVATGELVEESETEGERIAVFAAERAIEPPSVFAGDLKISEKQHGDTLLRTYFPADAAALAPIYLENAGRYLDSLEKQIGPYPYSAFHIVAGPLPLGMGFPGLTYVSERILRLPFMQTRSLAHEIAHSWWGNGIAIDYESGNWAEGLTTYMADYALAAAQGEEAAREMRLGWLRDYAALPKDQDWPAKSFVSKTHDAQQVIGYNKVALIFHMLERELTPEVFNAGLRGFWEAERFNVAGWQELQAAFEAAASKDLSWFFGQWIDRPGAPQLHLEEVATETVEDGHRLRVTLRQDKPSYRLAVPLRIDTEAGSETVTLALDGQKAEGSFTVKAQPTRVSVDPGYDLFRRLSPEEATPIFRDVTLNGATRIVAAVGADAEAAQAAEDLSARLVPRPPGGEAVKAAADPSAPLLIVGLDKELPAVLAKNELPPLPEALASKGTARAWTRRRADGRTAMIVAAKDAESLAVLLRPLPHYRRYGYVVFEGRKAIDKGVWPPKNSPLVKRLD